MKTTKEMKAAVEKMLSLYDESERLFDSDEEASDRAYEEAHAICEELSSTIVRVTRGIVSMRGARAIVLGNPEKLIEICEKHG